jgi:thioredoxin reductase
MAILGGAAHSVAQALMWRQWTDDLTFVTPDSSTLSSTEREQLSARDIRVVEGTIDSLAIDDDDRLRGVVLADGTTIPVLVLVIAPRFSARGALLSTLDIELSEHPAGIGSQISADATGRTTDPGTWVAGNVADVSAGIMQSAASGVLAAAAINGDLIRDDVAHAVESVRHQ